MNIEKKQILPHWSLGESIIKQQGEKMSSFIILANNYFDNLEF